MLTYVKASFAHHVQAGSSSLQVLLKKPLSTLITVIVIAITLTLPVLFLVFTSNIEQLILNWESEAHITLYLKPLSASDEQNLVAKVKQMHGVSLVNIKSAAEGLAELQQQEGMQDLMQFLPENPLPTVVEVTPDENTNSPSKLEDLFNQLKILPEIEQAKLDKDWINRLHAIARFSKNLANSLMILIACAVFFIIGNTLRLAIQNRQDEIKILKLIGATDTFILRPFLYSGAWYGFGGAIGAILLVNLFVFSISFAVNRLVSVFEMQYPIMGISLIQAITVILISIFLGLFAAFLSVKRQLAFIEPAI